MHYLWFVLILCDLTLLLYSVQFVSLLHCRSLRQLSSNQLDGTIPPELANLTKLQKLYAQNRIALALHFTLCIISLIWPIISDLTLVIICEIMHLQLVWLSLFQAARFESALWLHTTSARQPLSAATAVHSESHRSPFDACVLSLVWRYLLNSLIWHCCYLFMINDRRQFVCIMIVSDIHSLKSMAWLMFSSSIDFKINWSLLFNWFLFTVALLGRCTRILLLAPSLLSSATSLCSNSCTLDVALFSKWHL